MDWVDYISGSIVVVWVFNWRLIEPVLSVKVEIGSIDGIQASMDIIGAATMKLGTSTYVLDENRRTDGTVRTCIRRHVRITKMLNRGLNRQPISYLQNALLLE